MNTPRLFLAALLCWLASHAPARADLTANFTSATDVPVTTDSYVASGTASLSLGYAPATGATLTVVKNTGLNFISGSFSNLAHGQTLALSYGGVTYHFIANYYGGSGNDLVLQWANVRLMAWGWNEFGQLGNGNSVNLSAPSELWQSGSDRGPLGGLTVLSTAVGRTHSLVITSAGAVYSRSRERPYFPYHSGSWDHKNWDAMANKRAIAIAAGGEHSLALCSDGTLVAWGKNSSGQLGNGSRRNTDSPDAVIRTGALANKTVVALAAGLQHNLVLCSDGTLSAWGDNSSGQIGQSGSYADMPVTVSQSGALVGKSVIAITAGGKHNLALCSDGTLVAWGDNLFGQLGNNSSSNSQVPVPVLQNSGVLAGKTITAIAAGHGHSLALCSDGTLAAWGYNGYGQLGNNSSLSSSVPVAVRQDGVLAGKTVTSISSGELYCLAQCSDGTLATWGYNNYGQLGIGSTTNSPVPVAVVASGLSTHERFISVGSGQAALHSFAFVAGYKVKVTGNNVDIPSGWSVPNTDDGTDFGSMAVLNSRVTHHFTFHNPSALPLTSAPTISINANKPEDFSLTVQPQSSVPGGGSTTFAITFDPRSFGYRQATVTILSESISLEPFAFTIRGFGTLASRIPQTIGWPAPAPSSAHFSPGVPLYLSAMASSGLPVTLTVISGPATIADGYLLYPEVPGTVRVRATQAGDANFLPAPPVTLEIVIKPAPTSLTLTELNHVYDGTPKLPSYVGAGSVAEVRCLKSGQLLPEPPMNAGSYTVQLVGASGTVLQTGTMVIAKAPLFAIPDNKHKFAGQANPALSMHYITLSGADPSEEVTQAPVLKTTATASSPGGQYPITASGGAAANYYFVHQQGTMIVDSFAGSYEAQLVDGDSEQVGKLSLLVAANSTSFSGKLFTATEDTALPLTGMLATYAATETAIGACSVTKGSATYVVSFTMPLHGSFDALVERNAVALGSANDGRRLLTLARGRTVAYRGAHTAVLAAARPAGSGIPGGAGWATVGIGGDGVMTLAGKLGDGTAFTTSAAPDGETDPGYRLFVQPYIAARAQAYLAGSFALLPHPTLTSRRYVRAAGLRWVKQGLPTDASYRANFGPVTTELSLDPWLAPQKGTATLSAISLAARLGLSGAPAAFTVAHSDTGSAANASLPTALRLSLSQAVSVTTPAANATKWQTTLNPTTGAFTGSFELLDGTLKRAVGFSGVLRQPADAEDSTIGEGHYLLPPLVGSERLTGELRFSRP